MPSDSDRILVTGAGVTGGEVLRRLAAGNRTVCALVRNAERAEPLRKLGVQLIEGDFSQRGSWQRALGGIASVFNITVAHRDAIAWNSIFLDCAKDKQSQACCATFGHERLTIIAGGISPPNGPLR